MAEKSTEVSQPKPIDDNMTSEELVEELVGSYQLYEETEQRIKDLWDEFYTRERDNRVSIRYLATRMDANDKVAKVTYSTWNRRKLRFLGLLKPRTRK